jgi:hypothetical protein
LEVGADNSGCSGKENLEGNPTPPGESEHLFRTPEGSLKSEIQSSTQLTIRSMLSLLEQSYELPDEHFLSVAMFYNNSTQAQSFQASSNFCAVPSTKETDLEEMNPGMASSVLPRVSTGYHEMAIRMKTREDDLEADEKALEESSYKSPAKAHAKTKRGHPYKPAVKDKEAKCEDLPCSQEPSQQEGLLCSVACDPIRQM